MNSNKISQNHKNYPKAVIITALSVEYMAVRYHLTNLKEYIHPKGTVYELGTFIAGNMHWDVGIVEIGAGNANASLEAERAISYFNPTVALFVGVAGGVKDVSLGDVVAATKVYGYEFGKVQKAFRVRPEIGNPSYSLIQRVRAESKKKDWLQRIPVQKANPIPKVLLGPIAAGEKVIASTHSSIYDFLQKNYNDTLAIEMEGYGFLHAAHANQQVNAIVIRGISDLIDGKSKADATGSQEIASLHASAFAFEILAKFYEGKPSLEINTYHGAFTEDAKNLLDQNFPPPNAFFTGRENILKELHDRLISDRKVALTQLQAISGLGGIGKTQLAIEYAKRCRGEYKAMLWVNAHSRETIITGFVGIAAFLNLPEKGAQKHSLIIDAVKRWLKINHNWLLIFDNADQPNLVNEFLPNYSNGNILLTSRAQVFDMLGIANPIEVKELSPEEALHFLYKRTGRPTNDHAEKNAAKELGQGLGYLPLALEQAASYITAKKARFQDYLSSYRKHQLKLLERSKPITGDYPTSVATTWVMNFKEVKKLSKAAADLLSFSAFLDPDSIPLELIIKGAMPLGSGFFNAIANTENDPLVINEILEPLTRYSLISLDLGSNTYNIHRLVQTVLKDNMDKETQGYWAEQAVRAIDKAFPDVEFKNWPLCDRLLPHALSAARIIKDFNFQFIEASYPLNQAGYYLFKRAQYDEAEPLYNQSLEIRERALGADHSDVAIAYNNLASLNRARGKYIEAETLYKHALEIYQKALGPEHPDVATVLNNLGSLNNAMGTYGNAEIFLKQSLDIRERALGPTHPHVATSLNNLAEFYCAQGKCHRAEPLYKRALTIREKTLGINHPNLATVINNLADCYCDQKKYTEAKPLYKRALEIKKRALGLDHPDVGIIVNNLAKLYYHLGEYTEAEVYFMQALKIGEKTLGPDHPYIATILNNLGALFYIQGKYEETKPLYERALTIREKTLAPAHPDIAQILENYAKLLQKMGKKPQATKLKARARAISAKHVQGCRKE